MSLTIAEWNLNPNRLWFVRLADAGPAISVDLYPTQADAAADTNRTATGSASYGSGMAVALDMIAGSLPEISFFNDALPYHLRVSGQAADPTKTYQIKPFVDLPEISNSIYRSEALIQKKALHEINKHTHVSKIRSLSVANPIASAKTGDVVRIQSSRRDLDVLATITELTIQGTPDSLINQIETVEYIDLSHG